MLPEFLLNQGRLLLRRMTGVRKRKLLPGASDYEHSSNGVRLKIQLYSRFLFAISVRSISTAGKIILQLKEKNTSLRFEALLSRQQKQRNSQQEPLLAGQYQIVSENTRDILLDAEENRDYFVASYAEEWLEQAGIKEALHTSRPRPLTSRMLELIRSILHNPYDEALQQFHYENCIRDLLLQHLVNSGYALPGELNERDEAAILSADSIIAQDLQAHYFIRALAEKVGINEHKLKRGFRLLFNMGVFERLTWHRMEHARMLLETTPRTIDDIAGEVGYTSRSNFITSFRKHFSVTPKQYRKRFAGRSNN